MDHHAIKPWELDDIPHSIDNITIFKKFIIIDNSSNIKKCEKNDIITTIKHSSIQTGIMISNIKTNNTSIYLLIMDSVIFIINQKIIHQCREYFTNHLKSILFFTLQCQKDFLHLLSEENDQTDIIQNKNIDKKIKYLLIDSILKKFQYRTLIIRHNLLPNQYNSNNKYNFSDFIFIKNLSKNANLYLNTKDQILNVLKHYNEEINYNHEIKFYKQIENSFPYICKIYGITKNQNQTILVLEYIEGLTLEKFILKHKNINFSTKIKIIIEILFSVYYVHSNGFFLRDLKSDNIIIDSSFNSILIDFDWSKKIISLQNEEEHTAIFGNPYFLAPEQSSSNVYSYKVDIYSIGKIIHFIITETIYKKKDKELSKFYDNKVYLSLLNKYKDCFEYSQDLRPNIAIIIIRMVFHNNDCQELKKVNKEIMPTIIKELLKYEHKLKPSINCDFETSIEKSYLHYFLGYVLYFGFCCRLDKNRAIHFFEQASNQNNSDAQYILAGIYFFGDYIQQDINKTIYYLIRSSNNNNPKAQCLVGGMYHEGIYVQRDINKAIEYLTLSANQNYPNAQYSLGIIYYKGLYIQRNINKSIKYLTLAAKQNYSNAQYILGTIYYEGIYVQRDIYKSIEYLTLSAKLNNPKAQCLLGIIYYRGKYIQRNIIKSIEYLTLAANQNDSYAQLYLGSIYYDGEYIQHDINKSLKYLIFALKRNNPHAQYFLAIILFEGKYLPQDINKVIQYLMLASYQDHYLAQYFLGMLYYNGEYVERNIFKAIDLLTLSVKKYSKSLFHLGIIYYDGKYIQRDINKSIYYFKEASCFYDSRAKNNLAIIFKNGDGVIKNIYYSIEYLEESIKQKNDSYSIYNLSRIYYFGIGINKNIKRSIQLLEQLSNNEFPLANLFLYFFYSFGDKSIINQNKAKEYFNKIEIFDNINTIKFYISKKYINIDEIFYQRLLTFYKEYDIVYSDKSYYYLNFLLFMITGSLEFVKYSNTYNSKLNQIEKILVNQDVNQDFYDGFYSN